MKDIWKEDIEGVKKINKKKIAITIIVVILFVTVIVVVGLYLSNEMVRDWMDKNIFRKEIEQDTAATIELNEGQNRKCICF